MSIMIVDSLSRIFNALWNSTKSLLLSLSFPFFSEETSHYVVCSSISPQDTNYSLDGCFLEA